MTALIIASSEAGAGRSLVAAAIAYRLGREGKAVRLVRVAGDDGAEADAAAFARLDGIVSPGRALTLEDMAGMNGDVMAEIPAGAAGEAANKLAAKVVVVGGADAAPVDVSPALVAGTVLTRVPASELATVAQRAGLLAALPEDPTLAAPSVADIVRVLSARRLAGDENASIDRVMIGTVASDSATPYFANRPRTCIVTRFDKTDIQLAALQTDLHCLVLTGGGEPSPYLLDRVAGHRPDVALLLADAGTVESVQAIEGLFGASRFEGEGKLLRTVELLDAAGVSVEL